jgi:SPOR domain
MTSGAAKPGQPTMGQRSIFGGGTPVFARMPAYTPVTRGHDPREQYQPEPVRPDYGACANPDPARGHPSAHYSATQSYPSAANAYPSANQGPPQSYPSADHGTAQAYPGANYGGAQSVPSNGYRDPGCPDASYPDANSADASFPDASFPETSLSTNPAYAHEEPLNLEGAGNGYDAEALEQSYEPYTDEAVQNSVMASQAGAARAMPGSQGDPHRQLQAFDAIYDQPPQIPLGATEQTRRTAQGFYDGERADADFLDESQAVSPAGDAQPGARPKMTMKGRSVFMVGSALLGAVALGGALAFAYKQSGGGMSDGQPPLVQADSRPVKEAPEQPGGKDFPHKNKLIYDRLENSDHPEAEHLVPRQEELAVPSMPGATATAGLQAPAAAPDQGAPQTTQSVGAPPANAPAVASVDDPDAADGGPRRVKTLVVRPDGSVQSAANAPTAAQPAPAKPAGTQVASAQPTDVAAPAAPQVQAHVAAAPPAPQQVAAIPPAPAPAPAKPKPVKTASADAAAPQASATRSAGLFVVQVGSKQNQTEALATFADMQQKYPTLLANYRPMVQKADLGKKGTWYRLRIGPINDKTAAAKLCTQLKSQGLGDCLVMNQ